MSNIIPISEHVANKRIAPMAHVRMLFHLYGICWENPTIIVLDVRVCTWQWQRRKPWKEMSSRDKKRRQVGLFEGIFPE